MKEKITNDKDMEQIIEYMRRWNKESAKNSLEKYVKAKEDEKLDKRNYEIVNNMVKQNFTINIIKNITGLTEKEINDILKTN